MGGWGRCGGCCWRRNNLVVIPTVESFLMSQFLMQLVFIPLWMLLTCCVLLVALFGLLVVVLFLRPSAVPIVEGEASDAQLAVLEERLAGVMADGQSHSLRNLEWNLGIGFTDGAGRAALQAVLGRWHARGKIKGERGGYRLVR